MGNDGRRIEGALIAKGNAYVGPGEPWHGESNLSKKLHPKCPPYHPATTARLQPAPPALALTRDVASALLCYVLKSLPTNFAAKEKAGYVEGKGKEWDAMSKADDENNNK